MANNADPDQQKQQNQQQQQRSPHIVVNAKLSNSEKDFDVVDGRSASSAIASGTYSLGCHYGIGAVSNCNNNNNNNNNNKPPDDYHYFNDSVLDASLNDDEFYDAAAINDLSELLQEELRAAKTRHLACTEVSVPWDLTSRIATEMLKTSEREPCGIRGCTVFIEFEDEPNNIRRIGSIKVDPNTVSTFELYLTLKQDKRGWTSLLPQFLKNLTRRSTIMISPDFKLTKIKLYSCE